MPFLREGQEAVLEKQVALGLAPGSAHFLLLD